MKKTLIFAVFIISMFACAAAISTDMKDSYEGKETMIIEISGNILEPISIDNVKFTRGHVGIPVEFDLKRVGDKYYLWAIAPANENNYTLTINQIATIVAGNTQKLDYMKNFSVAGNITDYYINPGFIVSNKNFDITAYLNEDVNKGISVDFPEGRELILKPGSNKISFSIADVESTSSIKIAVGKYSVPAYIIKQVVPETDEEEPIPFRVAFRPDTIETDISSTENLPMFNVELINEGNDSLNNIKIDYNKEIFTIEPSGEISLEKNKPFMFNLSFNKYPGDIDENITAIYGDEIEVLPIKIRFVVPETDEEGNVVETPVLPHCSELEGILCRTDESCDGQSSLTIESSTVPRCCVGTCVQGSGASLAWLGYALIVIVVAVVGFLIYKYKKAGNKENPFKRTVQQAEKKISDLP